MVLATRPIGNGERSVTGAGLRWVRGALVALCLPLLLLVAYTGFFSLRGLLVHYPLVTGGAPGGIHGAYHVHSTRSDGQGTPEQIAHAAKKAGLQFVVLTDHNQEKNVAP